MNVIDTIGVVIPVYNPPVTLFERVLVACLHQTYPVQRVVILDSSPSRSMEYDGFLDERCDVLRVESGTFDHGGTRNQGTEHLVDCDAVVFLTQDAVMAKDCVGTLRNFMNQNQLNAAFARQVARREAGVVEKFDRHFNYPTTSRIVSGRARSIQDVFFSDVCSMVCIRDFHEIGGFPEPILTNEDVILAAKLLENGYKYGYCSDAVVTHSHPPAFWKNFRRFFDTGAMHRMWDKELPTESVGSKGLEYLSGSMRAVLKESPTQIITLLLHIISKGTGYLLGKYYNFVPHDLRLKISANRTFWG